MAAENAYTTYMNGIENSLKLNNTEFLISTNLSIADICFFCEYMQFTLYFQENLSFQINIGLILKRNIKKITSRHTNY